MIKHLSIYELLSNRTTVNIFDSLISFLKFVIKSSCFSASSDVTKVLLRLDLRTLAFLGENPCTFTKADFQRHSTSFEQLMFLLQNMYDTNLVPRILKENFVSRRSMILLRLMIETHRYIIDLRLVFKNIHYKMYGILIDTYILHRYYFFTMSFCETWTLARTKGFWKFNFIISYQFSIHYN